MIEDYGKDFTSPLIPMFTDLDNLPKHFIFGLEDQLLIDHVRQDEMDFASDSFTNKKPHMSASKFILDGHLNVFGSTRQHKVIFMSEDQHLEKTKWLRLINQGTDYRTTLHTCIWDSKYFARFLKPEMSAWQFEVDQMDEARNDGANIYSFETSKDRSTPMEGIAEESVFPTINLYLKGNFQSHALELIREEDKNMILEVISKTYA